MYINLITPEWDMIAIKDFEYPPRLHEYVYHESKYYEVTHVIHSSTKKHKVFTKPGERQIISVVVEPIDDTKIMKQ